MTDKMTIEQAIVYLKNHYLVKDENGHNAVMDMAIEALEKQIPKKPITKDVKVIGSCKNCKNSNPPYECEKIHECDNCNRWWNGICHWWNLNATEPTDFCSFWVKKESDTE